MKINDSDNFDFGGPGTKSRPALSSYSLTMRHATRVMVLLGAISCITALPACRVGGYSKPERENESLRTRVKDLSEKLALASAERDELRVKLWNTLEPAGGAAKVEVIAATPSIVALEIDSFSGYVPADEKLPATGAVAYVRTLDGRRRFTQAVGTLIVEIWSNPATDMGGAPLSRITLTPSQLREAYRSSLTGTHYAVELLLPSPIVRSATVADTSVLRATYTDAITGEVVKAELPLGTVLPPPSKGKKAM